jgi:hypothetical protein
MKDTAEILKFKGKELKTAADINAVSEALMCDLLSGAVTPREARKIQKEINERLKLFGSAIKILKLEAALMKLKP